MSSSEDVRELSIFERAKVIGLRAEQLARGAPAFVDVSTVPGAFRGGFDACAVASAELDAGKLPMIVSRTLSDGRTELVRLHRGDLPSS